MGAGSRVFTWTWFEKYNINSDESDDDENFHDIIIKYKKTKFDWFLMMMELIILIRQSVNSKEWSMLLLKLLPR